MPTVLRIEEGAPASYPALSTDDGAIAFTPAVDEAPSVRFGRAAWQRIESYVAYRWNTRTCTFTIEGVGEWVPPLKPFTPTAFERWNDDAWTSASFAPSPLGGLVLDGAEMFRIWGNLGAATAPPAVVIEAVRRLAEFMEAADGMAAGDRGASRQSVNLSGAMSVETERSTNWLARSLQQSGAADLLRPYRVAA